MSLAGLILVLAAAVCHATWNFFVKKVSGGAEFIWLFSVVAAVVYFPFATYILVTAPPAFTLLQVIFIIGSLLLHLGYFMLLQAGYRQGDLSLVYPTARATGPLLSTMFAVLFLGEYLTVQMAIGGAAIIFGVLMLTGGFRRKARHIGLSLMFGLAAGAFIGSYTVWDAYAVSVLMLSPLLLDYAITIGRVALLAPLAYRRRETVRMQWREHRSAVLIVAIFSPLAYILVLYAMAFTPVAYVAPTRETSVVLVVLAGSLLLGEGQLKWRLGWAVFIFAGMALLVSG